MKPRNFLVSAILITLGFLLTGIVISQNTSPSNWVQSNEGGFGDLSNNGASALSPFDGHLYAGTLGKGAKIYRKDASGWSSVMDNGFGNSHNEGINDLIEFGDSLYANTFNVVNGGQIWRSNDGASWNQIISDGFGDQTNGEIFRFAEFEDNIYASTSSFTTTHGAELWRSDTGDEIDWTRVVTNGFNGDMNNSSIISLEVYSKTLFAGTYNEKTGGEVWRSSDGLSWKQVNTDGFDTATNQAISALATYNGMLYASTLTRASGVGAEVWRCQMCNGGDWIQVVDGGFGDDAANELSALETLSGYLYFVVGNRPTGMEVWRCQMCNGRDWVQVGFDGFGDHNNRAPYWDNSVTVSNRYLYVGTINISSEENPGGGEVWKYVFYEIYTPLVLR